MAHDQHRPGNIPIHNRLLNNRIHSRKMNGGRMTSRCGDSCPRLSSRAQPGILHER